MAKRVRVFLPDQAFARDSDPETSHEVMNKISGSTYLAGLQIELVKVVQEKGRGTAREFAAKAVERGFGDLNSINPRFAPLERKGVLKRYGKKPDETTGQMSTIWGLAPGIIIEDEELYKEAV